jgi:hypothetical protein
MNKSMETENENRMNQKKENSFSVMILHSSCSFDWIMARYFYFLFRKKRDKKIVIKNTKPKFLCRVNSGEFNFPFDDKKNHVSWEIY